MKYEDVEFVTVNHEHYELTHACIKSINAQCTNINNIRVFDNSSNIKFKNIFSNVDVISNFNEEIFKKEKTFGGDVLHSLAIKHLIETSTKKYMVLCDSDVIFKRDLDFLLDDDIELYASFFELLTIPNDHVNRALPFLQVFNIEMIKNKNISYYQIPFESHSDYYTGQFFLKQLYKNNLKFKLIKINKYINHLQYVRKRSQIDINNFIKQNERYFTQYFYVISPFAKTGGPENLQQIASAMKHYGYQSKIVYLNNSTKHYDEYAKYKNDIELMKNIVDEKQNFVILPEYFDFSKIDNVIKLKHARIIISWLSIDNCKNIRNKDDIKNVFNKLNIYANFAQSQYAYDYLIKHDMKNVYSITDYINEFFITYRSQQKKEKIIAYSPKRGYSFFKKIEDSMKSFNFIRLEKMNKEQLCNALDKSMIYVDFGNHPGKDRIPREACCRNCIVITSKNGSAANSIDVPIPDEYKFDIDSDNAVSQIIEKIKYALNNYNAEILKYKSYKEKILQEKEIFYNEVASVCKSFLHFL